MEKLKWLGCYLISEILNEKLNEEYLIKSLLIKKSNYQWKRTNIRKIRKNRKKEFFEKEPIHDELLIKRKIWKRKYTESRIRCIPQT
jgi:HEPN domain-containing protein